MLARILLVEEDRDFQQTVTRTLTNEQIETVCADDGMDALCLLNETNPDVLIAEIALPEKSGYELCRYVRQEQDFQSLPVVLLDGDYNAFNQSLALSVGADVYLSKPFEASELIDIVRKLLENREDIYGERSVPVGLAETDGQFLPSESHDSARPYVARGADEIVTAGRLPQARTPKTSLPETVAHHPGKRRNFVLLGLLAVAILAAAWLAVLQRALPSVGPAINEQSPTTETVQVNTVPAPEQRLAAVGGRERLTNLKAEEPSSSDGNGAADPIARSGNAEATETSPPNVETSRDAPAQDSSARVVARKDSPHVGNDQPNAQMNRPRSVMAVRSNTVRGHLRRSGQEMKESGKHFGSGAKHFGQSSGKAVEWVGKKTGRGVKRIGKALKSIF